MTKVSTSKIRFIAAYAIGVAAIALIAALAYPAYKDVRLVPAEAKTSDCTKTGNIVGVNVGPDKISPDTIKVDQCDVIVFTNRTDAIIEIAMGNHDNHIEYPGLEEILTDPGKTYTLVARETGQYRVHDHIKDALEATLIVYE